jgi:hypothetical protein
LTGCAQRFLSPFDLRRRGRLHLLDLLSGIGGCIGRRVVLEVVLSGSGDPHVLSELLSGFGLVRCFRGVDEALDPLLESIQRADGTKDKALRVAARYFVFAVAYLPGPPSSSRGSREGKALRPQEFAKHSLGPRSVRSACSRRASALLEVDEREFMLTPRP